MLLPAARRTSSGNHNINGQPNVQNYNDRPKYATRFQAKFRWERPGGPAASFDLDLTPSSGVLRGKEVRKMAVPLGFTDLVNPPIQ